jgi:hypothetical protein
MTFLADAHEQDPRGADVVLEGSVRERVEYSAARLFEVDDRR